MLFGAVSADSRDCCGNKCRKAPDSARKAGHARRASPAVNRWSTDCKEPRPAKQLKSYIASGNLGRGEKGIHAKAQRREGAKEGQASKKCVSCEGRNPDWTPPSKRGALVPRGAGDFVTERLMVAPECDQYNCTHLRKIESFLKSDIVKTLGNTH